MLDAARRVLHSGELPRRHNLSRNNPSRRYNRGPFSRSHLSSSPNRPNSNLRLNHNLNSRSLSRDNGRGQPYSGC